MNKGIQQKLFEYFHQEHKIMLLDGDYNEIEHILRSELCQSVLTDEQIEVEAKKYAIERYGTKEAWGPDRMEIINGFCKGAKFFRGTVVSVLTDEEIETIAQKRFPHKSIEHQKALFIGGAKFARDKQIGG